MPARKPDTVLSWPTARDLAALASCDPRTIQHAAKGEIGPGDSARRAREVVAAYFDRNPGERPATWKRPPEAPLLVDTAVELAKRAGVDVRTIQRAARGTPPRGDDGRRAREVVDAYLREHPEARPDVTAPSDARAV